MDLHTLHVSSAITNVTCGFVLAVAWCVREEKPFLGWWSGAFLVFALGLLLQVRHGEPIHLEGALTYGFLVAGTLLMLAGFRAFDGRPAFSRPMRWTLPLPPMLHLSLTAAFPGSQIPELATFLLACLVAAQVPAYILLRNAERLAFRWIAGATLTVQLLVTLSVVVWGSTLVTPENVALTISLSDQVCSTILIACVLGMTMERDNRRLDRVARRDALTGCLNRAGLMSYMAGAAGSHGVLVADLDHFKQLNDRHGHAAGDEALRAFVRLAERGLPPGSVFARSGGEEFVALLPGAALAEARGAAARLLEDMNGMRFDHAGTLIRFTVSIGVAVVSADEPISNGIRRADMALYRAKEEGRNRLAVHDACEPAAVATPLPT